MSDTKPRGKSNVVDIATRRRFNLTDYGNAERIVARHGRDLLFTPKLGWLVWDGDRFRRDETGEAMRRAKETARSLYTEAGRIVDDGERQAVAKHALECEKRDRLRAALELAQSERQIAIDASELDSHPMLLNCTNGTIDLETGVLRAADRADKLTRMCGVEFDPTAEAPRWEQFLAETQPDEEIRAFLQRLAGYWLTGAVRQHTFPVFWGEGRNGKGTYLGALQRILGASSDGGYSAEIASRVLMSTKHRGHQTELMPLFGARLVVTSETASGDRLDVALVKQLTGGDKMSARYCRRDTIEWWPTHKIVMLTNNRPVIDETTEAIWQRILLVPWTQQFTGERQDPELNAKLDAEAPGILAWAVRGCVDWQAKGLDAPEAVRAATEGYREDEDPIGRFIGDCCCVYKRAEAPSGELYAAFKEWLRDQGEDRAMTQTAFGRELAKRGFGVERRRVGKVRVGLGLKTEAEDGGRYGS